mmetsp:Transcript_27591/g.40745  ORF Transcript_27591/g.40745 Transcript_27591/m.40745 type:complete len:98 (+) Transcript_27591:73-366(+)
MFLPAIMPPFSLTFDASISCKASITSCHLVLFFHYCSWLLLVVGFAGCVPIFVKEINCNMAFSLVATNQHSYFHAALLNVNAKQKVVCAFEGGRIVV